MGLTLSALNNDYAIAATVTITIPANSAVMILVGMDASGNTCYQGSVSDTGGNTYLPAGGGVISGGGGAFCDSFYCLNTNASATWVTYTPSASLTVSACFAAAWVWAVSGGTAVFGSQANNSQSSPGTGTNAVTSGSVTCSTGSVIAGILISGDSTQTAGTGFTQDYQNGGFCFEHGAFNSSQGATLPSPQEPTLRWLKRCRLVYLPAIRPLSHGSNK